YLLVRKYDASTHTLAIVFFAIGILQALSFHAAVRFARRIGPLRTMVCTHLPSNLLLAATAFAPNLGTARVLLCARVAPAQVHVRSVLVVFGLDHVAGIGGRDGAPRLPRDPQDRERDDEADDRIADRRSESHDESAGDDAQRHVAVRSPVIAVRDHRRAREA